MCTECRGAHRKLVSAVSLLAGSLLIDNYAYRSNCICEDGYYEIVNYLDCQPCHQSCAKCVGPAASCLECKGEGRSYQNCSRCANISFIV